MKTLEEWKHEYKMILINYYKFDELFAQQTVEAQVDIWIEDDVWTETDPVDAVAEDLSYWSD